MKPELHFGDAKIVSDNHYVQVWAHHPYKLIKKDGAVTEWKHTELTWVHIPAQDTFKLDIPGESVLHEFRGMQYLGPVERDDELEKKIKELLVKFQGALVVAHDCNTIDVLHNGKLIAAGCGTIMDVIGKDNLNVIGRCPSNHVSYFSIARSVVSLESIRAAKVNKNEFMNNYERMVQL